MNSILSRRVFSNRRRRRSDEKISIFRILLTITIVYAGSSIEENNSERSVRFARSRKIVVPKKRGFPTDDLVEYDFVEFRLPKDAGKIVHSRKKLVCRSNRTFYSEDIVAEDKNMIRMFPRERGEFKSNVQDDEADAIVRAVFGNEDENVKVYILERNLTGMTDFDECSIDTESLDRSRMEAVRPNETTDAAFTSASRAAYLDVLLRSTRYATTKRQHEEPCVQIPSELLGDSYSISLIEESIGIDTKGPGVFDPLMGMLKPALAPLEPIGNMLGSLMNAIMSPLFKASIGQQIGPGLGDVVPRLVRDMLTESLVAGLVGPVSESVSATLSPAVTDSLLDYLTRGMTQHVTIDLVPQLSSTLDRILPKDVDDFVPETLARRVGKTLTRLLTRSITESVVPALIHTVSHSPLQDYYCYYCYHFSVYCAYCHYAPSQLYYAQYYSSYYSMWYGNFFGAA